MLQIKVENLGKKFNRDWIFKNLSFEVNAGKPVGIIGSNGSGKSTLVQCLIQSMQANTGHVSYYENSKLVLENQLHAHISLASPYMNVLEEFTLMELLNFHQQFKPMEMPVKEIIEILNFSKHKNKLISDFSSGMKQRLKLVLALFSKSNFIFLDEPTANLDHEGVIWYKSLVNNYIKNRTLIVASNSSSEELFCCNTIINILDYK